MKNWEEIEEKIGIKCKLQDGSFRPVNEWLDDLYLKYTKEQAGQIVMSILENGDTLFSSILTHKQ